MLFKLSANNEDTRWIHSGDLPTRKSALKPSQDTRNGQSSQTIRPYKTVYKRKNDCIPISHISMQFRVY